MRRIIRSDNRSNKAEQNENGWEGALARWRGVEQRLGR
jgi:hypothetical protein